MSCHELLHRLSSETFNIDLEVVSPVLLLWVLATVCLKGGTATALHHSLISRFAPAVFIHALHSSLNGSPQAIFPVFWAAAIYGDRQKKLF